MTVRRDLDDRAGMADGLELLAAVREAEGDPAAAARHLATAHALRQAAPDAPIPDEPQLTSPR